MAQTESHVLMLPDDNMALGSSGRMSACSCLGPKRDLVTPSNDKISGWCYYHMAIVSYRAIIIMTYGNKEEASYGEAAGKLRSNCQA